MNTRTQIVSTIDMNGTVSTVFTNTDANGAVAQGVIGFAGALTVLAMAYPVEVKKLITTTTTTTTTQSGSTTTTTAPSIVVTLGLNL